MRVLTVLVGLAQVSDGERDALVQVGQFLEAVGEDSIVIDCLIENSVIGLEGHLGAAVVGFTHHLDRIEGFALLVLLDVVFAIAEHLSGEVVGEGVHAGDADTVQTAGDLVGVLVELATRVQDGHHHFKGGAVLLLVHIGRDTAPVVEDADGVVF